MGKQEFNFINSTSRRILLVVEPKSSEYWIKHGVSVRLLITDPAMLPSLDVEYLPGGIVIYARESSCIEVYQNGIRLAQGNRSRRMEVKLTKSVI